MFEFYGIGNKRTSILLPNNNKCEKFYQLIIFKKMENSELINNDEIVNYKYIKKMKYTVSVSNQLIKKNLEVLTSDNLVKTLKQNKHKIYDLNFACRIPPFETDAMGIPIDSVENEILLRQMLELQAKTNIKVSPVFNNIFVPNNYETLNLFVKHLKPLYERGIRSVTIPHVMWMKFGLLQKEFPELEVKNTVLRRVRDAQEFWNHASAGFSYVNIDRILLRDTKGLKEIHKAQQQFYEKTGKKVVTSLLTGEGCLGNCCFWEEHYQHTMTHPEINSVRNAEIFDIPQRLECQNVNRAVFPLFSTGFNVFKEDINELCQYFDVIKSSGRRNFGSLKSTLLFIGKMEEDSKSIIENINGKKDIITALYQKDPKLIDIWRNTIKNCRYQCWSCNLCTKLASELF